jgi:hypothetical protein
MRRYLLLIFFSVCYIYCSGQTPLQKIWDYRYGGTNVDALNGIIHTADGGYLMGGYSASDSSGDKSQPNWSAGLNDYWIVKTNSVGIKQWDKRYGGTGDEYLSCLKQTRDGGYVLGGFTSSGISGDKTQPLWGYYDYWIVKIDSVGAVEWDKRFGGIDRDQLTALQQTRDGGYILGGWSWSGAGGDKTQPNWDVICSSSCTADYWIVKTDSLGIKEWDARFGGSDIDYLTSLQQTSDGGYILGGYSSSDAGGDRTEPTRGYYDYWIVKTDSLGIKQWDRRYGTNLSESLYSIKQTADGGYLLGGIANAGINGDKTQPVWGGFDFWIIKTDSLGAIQWDKDYGGIANEDEMGEIVLTLDGGYLIPGTSYSGISGDKSEANLGHEQTWIIKVNSTGVKQWDKTIFTNTGSADDENGYTVQVSGRCYIVANSTGADIGGYKTQSSRGSWDYWFVKLCDSSFVETTNTINIESASPIYPNPFINQLSITSYLNSEIFLFDYTGKEILRTTSSSEQTVLNTEGIAAGFYIVRVESGSGVMNYKVVKE